MFRQGLQPTIFPRCPSRKFQSLGECRAADRAIAAARCSRQQRELNLNLAFHLNLLSVPGRRLEPLPPPAFRCSLSPEWANADVRDTTLVGVRLRSHGW